MNPLSLLFGIAFFPITFLGSWCIINPNEEIVVLYWGKLHTVRREPGIYFLNLWGRKIIRISTRLRAIELHKTTVADLNGNPIIMAGICTYRVTDSVQAALNVDDFSEYIRAQSIAVIKQIASKYPYESADGHSLKNEAGKIADEMVEILQKKIDQIGLMVLTFELSDLTYAPEIAPQMLARQQAQALISARKIIVEGAVQIVEDALGKITSRGIKFSDEAAQRLVSNLLVVICGDSKVTPTLAIEDDGDSSSNEVLNKMHAVLVEMKENAKPH